MEAADRYATSTLGCMGTRYGNICLPTNTFAGLAFQHTVPGAEKQKKVRKAKIIFLVLHNQMLQ